jgi:SAM-dependent methyltransferase
MRYPVKFLLRRPVRVVHDVLNNHGSRFASAYLRGLDGVEIGGSAANDFKLRTINVDKADNEFYRRDQRELCGRAMPVDVVAQGDELPFADDSYDFVLSSHVIEHMPDPVKALREWVRVARMYVFVVAPHRDRTFDRDQPVTSVEELLERHNSAFSSDEDRHWSVWTAETFIQLCARIGLGVIEYQDPDDKRCNGFAVLIDAQEGKSRDGAPRLHETPGAFGRRFGR